MARRKKRSASLLAALAALCAPAIAGAQLSITEIMYDLPSGSDSGREWIEVYNGGSEPLSLAQWRVAENGTAHKIAAISGGDAIPPGSYAVIADKAAAFREDWPAYEGPLFDSAFSLSNEGESVALRPPEGADASPVSYRKEWGGAGDGNSLNRAPGAAGAFVPRAPSPGGAMSGAALSPPPKTAKTGSSSKKKTAASLQGEGAAPAPLPESPPEDGNPETASAAAAPAALVPASALWWGAAAFIGIFGGAAAAAARSARRKEWRITEEP